jgi:hypothetical protein
MIAGFPVSGVYAAPQHYAEKLAQTPGLSITKSAYDLIICLAMVRLVS